MNDQSIFDHEKLDVYQVELSFIAWSSVLLSEICAAGEGLYREVCDQLDRASLSSLVNTAEGNGKRQGKQRAKFFDDARGSAVECAACLDALVARKLATIERVDEGKRLLFRTVGMLTKLVERFDSFVLAKMRSRGTRTRTITRTNRRGELNCSPSINKTKVP
jgi:four helix bundle protein